MPTTFDPVMRLAGSKSTMILERGNATRGCKDGILFIVAVAALGVASARAADFGDSADGFNQWLASSDKSRCKTEFPSR